MHIVLISGDESKFRNLLKIVSVQDPEYKKLLKKCTNIYEYATKNVHHIDAGIFFHFKIKFMCLINQILNK